MSYISFPGLGIEPFHLDKVAFSVFGRDVAWYGILITVGMVLAVLLADHLRKYEGLSSDDILDLAFTVIIFGVIGARAYYVIFSWGDTNYLVTDGGFFHNLFGTLYNCIALWNGGLAIYGGVLGGLLSAFVFSKIKRIKFLKLADILAPTCLVGQIIGRWGNFFNMEAHGGETDLPWRMGLIYKVDDVVLSEHYVHPTFLYESLWNVCVLAVVLLTYKKKKFDGQMFVTYLIGYGIGRTLIEGLRTDSLMIGSFRVSQLLSLILVVIGIVLCIILSRKAKKAGKTAEEYTPIYEEPNEKTE